MVSDNEKASKKIKLRNRLLCVREATPELIENPLELPVPMPFRESLARSAAVLTCWNVKDSPSPSLRAG